MSQPQPTVLILEDNPGDFFLVKEFLKRTSLPAYEIHHTERVADAIKLLQEQEFHLILMDLFLPDSEGIQTFMKIYPLAKQAPVIVLTGLVDEEVTLGTLQQGAQDYLIKGEYDEKLLEKTIRYSVERKHNQELIMRSEEVSRKKLEALVQERTRELEEAIKKEKLLVDLKNQFVAIASHEFRTPLSTIRFAAEYLHDYLEKIDEAEIRSKLKKIEKQVTHMTALLEDVIMAGRTDLKKILVVKSKIELRNLVDKIIEDVQNSTRNTHQIELNYNVNSKEIDTDEKLFRNIFINLLTNAIKYSPGKESVLLNIKEETGLLIITVTDQGIGISEEDQVKLFEAFQRGTNAASIAGTGLGLSIVKKAVELLKGSIRLQSGLNEGTTVEVRLPVATTENKPA
ncbi:MAG: hybrid sensor histidine kinase/response regulator [Cyclobacteriaceae bacterium]|nr:hybrid sensor histidine kinase/response regulator [Cyclobacteriaceae bacterium]